MTTRRLFREAGLSLALLALLAVGRAQAQSPPGTLTQLSLSELLKLDLGDEPERRWRLGYRYHTVRFDGYRIGTEQVSIDRLLFRPGMTRGPLNYPVVPTTVAQSAHLVDVGFHIDQRWSIDGTVPLVRQRTDHVSSVPGFEAFTIDTGGLGDIAVSVSHRQASPAGSIVMWTAGISLPTGSVEQRGETPRGNGVILPYTMQLGSGTADLLLGGSYATRHLPKLGGLRLVGWGAEASARMRGGRNDRNYRLGHQLAWEGWLRFQPYREVRTSVGLAGTWAGRISGGDEALIVPGPFPFVAPVADPAAYGGRKSSLRVSAELPWEALADAARARAALTVTLDRCLFISLNGPQPAERWRLAVGWNVSF
jgi:hypothetical protein